MAELPRISANADHANGPSRSDQLKIRALAWLRKRNHATVDQGSVRDFRRRHIPRSGPPVLQPACEKHPNMGWAPKELMVARRIPPEGKLPPIYKARYYGLAKYGFRTYSRFPMQAEVLWSPDFEWNEAFPSTCDGWEYPTSDETFARLRLQGPNPWMLHRVDDRVGSDGEPEATFELDFTRVLKGILPPIVARFAVRGDDFVATEIDVGGHRHEPGDDTWTRAKQVVNAADARYAALGRHLLEAHLVIGQAYALAAFSLPTWHPLRPFMQFFTYATLAVNDIAYQALVTEGSYFVESGFITVTDADRLFDNLVADFDLDRWNAPDDIARRGLGDIPRHPYVEDAQRAWPVFVDVVEEHLAQLGMDDATIAGDRDLQTWYITLTKMIPKTDAGERPLDRERLAEICTILLWNNVVHEVCGDLSPILESEDPDDKATLNLDRLRDAVGDGALTGDFAPPTMSDVFLLDQASFVSRFNVGGNSIVRINAARWVDDPKLRIAIEHLQERLKVLERDLVEANADRTVRFARMFPRHWEASISF